MAFVSERFELTDYQCDHLQSLVPKFGYNGFGEIVFYRTYSRIKADGGQETWADCIIRVINGVMSIRRDWYRKNHIYWDKKFWQQYAFEMAISAFNMEWTPPGRGLFHMGSEYMYEEGAFCVQNCGFTLLSDNFAFDLSWAMDALMNGVGVGFAPIRNDKMELYNPHGVEDYIIADSREGWVRCTRKIYESYQYPGKKKIRPIYDNIREAGLPIKRFGGISSGPEPLIWYHNKIEEFCERFKENKGYDSVRFKADCANATGCCIVAGNVRRSAEILTGKIHDKTFLDLKNLDINPDRENISWMSNNSVELENDEDFEMLGEIAKRVIKNGEPGYINKINLKYARLGKKMKNLRLDEAIGLNPCGEMPQEDKETCNVIPVYPTMCNDVRVFINKSIPFATLYGSTVSLLPTKYHCTNRIIAKNRRIGVSLTDYSGWKHKYGLNKVTKWMREGYNKVREINNWANDEAGVPRSIRVTTVQPGGTTPKLPGVTPGVGNPTFKETIRRINIAKNHPLWQVLVDANIPYEPNYDELKSIGENRTDIFEYPILQGPAEPAEKVSVWEQAMNLILVQREWADNAVSNTIYFKPKWPLIHHIDEDFEEELGKYIGHVEACNLLSGETNYEYIVPKRYKIVIKRNNEGDVKYVNVHEYDSDHEEHYIEPVLSAIAPVTKTVSVLPHTAKGAYRQMPEEGISRTEYQERLAAIKPIDWSKFCGSDGQDDRYCQGESCEIQYK